VTESLVVQGTPRAFDAFLRPTLRALQLTVGLGASLLLLCVGSWWWIPVPLAASFLLYELFFYWRADVPLTVRLTAESIEIEDRFLDRTRRVSLELVHSASLVYREIEPGRIDAVLLLSGLQQTLLAIPFRLDTSEWEARPNDVDADVCNAVLGSISGLIRALAPTELLVRQNLSDPRALAWFRNQLDPATWSRSTVRYWRGEAPELNLFGFHDQREDGLLHLDTTATWVDGDQVAAPVELNVSPPAHQTRTAILFRMHGEESEEAEELLPLWLQPLAGRTVAIPAPLADDLDERTTADPTLCHVHAPEGALILWHLWRQIPPDQWPAAWHSALSAARPTLTRWPDWIPWTKPTERV